MISRDVLSTGDVADFAGVAPRTVARWIDTNRLKGYRIPGSQNRRVPRKAFLEFIQKYDMPHPRLLPVDDVLIVSNSDELQTLFTHRLKRQSFEVKVAQNLFDAGAYLRQRTPMGIVYDLRSFAVSLSAFCRGLQEIKRSYRPCLFTISDHQEQPGDGVADHFRHPLDPELLVTRLVRLLGRTTDN